MAAVADFADFQDTVDLFGGAWPGPGLGEADFADFGFGRWVGELGVGEAEGAVPAVGFSGGEGDAGDLSGEIAVGGDIFQGEVGSEEGVGITGVDLAGSDAEFVVVLVGGELFAADFGVPPGGGGWGFLSLEGEGEGVRPASLEGGRAGEGVG